MAPHFLLLLSIGLSIFLLLIIFLLKHSLNYTRHIRDNYQYYISYLLFGHQYYISYLLFVHYNSVKVILQLSSARTFYCGLIYYSFHFIVGIIFKLTIGFIGLIFILSLGSYNYTDHNNTRDFIQCSLLVLQMRMISICQN